MQRKVMISCAVTGSADTPGRNPAVPVTPEQIAQSAIDAAKAGAAIVHIHVRDPKTTRPSMDPSLYKEVVDRIRGSGSDVLINLTTGPGARFVPGEDDPQKPGPGTTIKPPAERVRHVVALKPDIRSLDMASINFRWWRRRSCSEVILGWASRTTSISKRASSRRATPRWWRRRPRSSRFSAIPSPLPPTPAQSSD